jgi:fatty-acyl-CoA synthase
VRVSEWVPIDDDPVLETTVASILRDAAANSPGSVALVEGSSDPADRRRWTYLELLRAAEGAAARLCARFEPGERLASLSPSTPEALVLSYAAAMSGLVLVPVNPALRTAEVSYLLSQSGAAGVAVAESHRGADLRVLAETAAAEAKGLREIVGLAEVSRFGEPESCAGAPEEVSARTPHPDDVAQIVYTSGTTGFPKGARLTHRGLTNAARFGGIRFGLRPGDVYLDTMPLHHVGGQVVAFQICQHISTAVLVAGFEAGLVLELLESEHVDVTAGVPTMLIAMIEHPEFANRDLSTLRAVSSGGAVVPPDIVRHIEASLDAKFTICFGQTETSGFISQTHLEDSPEDKAASLGQPLPCVEARVMAPGSTGGARNEYGPLPCGEVGELQVRAPFVMAGYHEMPDANAEAFADGTWLRTGDLVRMDERGFLYIAGRAKDMIVSGGENVFPVEIEAVLNGHDDVAMAAVFGVPDHLWGERVVAVVRPVPGHSPDPSALQSYLKDRLASFKVPKQIHVTDELPLTASGKVQKFVLRDEYAAAPDPTGTTRVPR